MYKEGAKKVKMVKKSPNSSSVTFLNNRKKWLYTNIIISID